MPKREDIPGLVLEKTLKQGSYSLQVEGLPALLRKDLLVKEELNVGDKIQLFSLPDGRYFVSKIDLDSEGYTIGKLTTAHIYFDDEMNLEEK